MKVVHLVPAMEQGGVETVVTALNRALVGAGWQSVVISRGGRLVPRLVADGGRHLALDLKSKNPLSYFSRAAALRRVLANEKPDLVCAHSRVPAWLFVGANRRLGLRWITYAHGANSVSAYSAVMTRGNLTITPSRFLADYLKQHYALAEERLRVVNPAVDGARFDPTKLDTAFVGQRRRDWSLTPDDFVIMAVGRITPLKGYDLLIRSVAQFAHGDRRVRLVIVGDADRDHEQYLSSLRRLSSELGLDIIFAGGESKVPECLSLATVVVSANTTKPESFGLSMAEALTMGKPVVAKAFGGALDIVRNGVDGVLVPADAPENVTAFADALAEVRAATFTGLRESALARFNPETMLHRTLAAYAEALKV